jgi:DNA-binding helix-turn-helix protein
MLRNKLKAVRKEVDLTQIEVAKRLGITVRQYQAIEAGTSDGSIKVWRKLSELFHETIDNLLAQDV